MSEALTRLAPPQAAPADDGNKAAIGPQLRNCYNSYSAKMQYMNNSNTSIYLTLYTVVARRDCPDRVLYPKPFIPGQNQAYVDVGGDLESMIYADGIYNQSIADTAVGTGSPTTNNYQYTVYNYGTPIFGPICRTYYKVVKKRVVTLKPNEVHVHTHTQALNRMMRNFDIRAADGRQYSAYAGTTMYTVAVIRGLPAISADGSVLTTARVRMDCLGTVTSIGRAYYSAPGFVRKYANFPRAPEDATAHINPFRGIRVQDRVMDNRATIEDQDDIDHNVEIVYPAQTDIPASVAFGAGEVEVAPPRVIPTPL